MLLFLPTVPGAAASRDRHETRAAVREPGHTASSSPPEILVSRQLLENSRLLVGQVVSLSSDPTGEGARPFRVAGVYEPVADPLKITTERWEARLHLPDLLALTAPPFDPLASESVTSIHVALQEPSDALAFSVALQTRMPGLIANPTQGGPDQGGPFLVLERFHFAVALVTVIGSSAFLMALMVMRADERRETVGILRLIGLSRRRILGEILIEGLFIAACGALIGVVFAAATQGAVNRIFQWRYDTSLVFVRVTAEIALRCVALAVPLGVVAGLVASWTLLRRDIVTLLRR